MVEVAERGQREGSERGRERWGIVTGERNKKREKGRKQERE